MKKQEIFSKLKDYNNELEKILVKKDYSSDTKNLLLETVYKIEDSYDDYKIVKRDVEPKAEVIKKITENIKNNCEAIELLDPKQDIKMIIDKENGKIQVFPNEKYILYSIISIGKQNVDYINNVTRAIAYLFDEGNNINLHEIIRDFNGWSWNIDLKEIGDIICNLVYQNMQMLLGSEYINNWMKTNNIITLQSYFSKLYGKELAAEYVELLTQYSVKFLSIKDEKEKETLSLELESISSQLEKMENKVAFLGEISNNKKQAIKNISEIDKILSNKEVLRKEYEQTNAKLPLEKKIFSITHFSKMLVKQKNEELLKIKDCNELLDPKKYVAKKEELKLNFNIYNTINQSEDEVYKKIVRMQEIFIECISMQVKKAETKKDIIDLLYKFRYYNLTKCSNINRIKDINEIQVKLRNVQKELITKACNLKILNIFSQDIKYNYEIIKNMLYTNIINLENIEIVIKKKADSLVIKFYDADICELETIIENITVDINQLKIKLSKKQKLFV